MTTATKKRVKRQFIRTRAVSSTDALSLHIGIRTKSANGGRLHWGAIRGQRKHVAKLLAALPRPLLVKHVKFTRWCPGNGLDEDNLQVSQKHVRDQVVAWLQGLTTGDIDKDILARGDDTPMCGLTFEYEQFRNDAWGVTVTLS